MRNTQPNTPSKSQKTSAQKQYKKNKLPQK